MCTHTHTQRTNATSNEQQKADGTSAAAKGEGMRLRVERKNRASQFVGAVNEARGRGAKVGIGTTTGWLAIL